MFSPKTTDGVETRTMGWGETKITDGVVIRTTEVQEMGTTDGAEIRTMGGINNLGKLQTKEPISGDLKTIGFNQLNLETQICSIMVYRITSKATFNGDKITLIN
jgi:hypothetical protein